MTIHSGFAVDMLNPKEIRAFEAALDGGAVAVQAASLTAARATGAQLKERLRSFFDGVFQGSDPTRNNHRRATNAMVQSKEFDEVASKGQFTYFIYSKFGRGSGPDGFIDYLLLHLQGGTLEPDAKEWFRLRVSPDSRQLGRAGYIQTGYYPAAGTRVFFKPSDDGQELFLLRENIKTGRTQLLDVLLKTVTIAPRLAGLQPLLDSAGAEFERNVDIAWQQQGGTA